ncbi:hypothetical protein ACMSI6_08545 [Pseudomonas antarctica]|uniref:hypothetical protein n=1 Tax=Pseudomonas antarctica TaxID=219572 RepID=UPI00387ADFC6
MSEGYTAGGASGRFDQAGVDSRVGSFPGQGHASGTRSPEDAHVAAPELADYKAKHQKEWQARKDADARDKLFGQSTPGRVDGEEVQPFSSQRLSSESESLTSSAKAKVDKAAPARNVTLLRTAAIALPFSAMGLIIAGAVNAYTKTLIDPTPVPEALTKEEVKADRLVEQIKLDVFKVANVWNALNGYKDVAPGVDWVMKDNDERMDFLEEMLDISENLLSVDARKMLISVSYASTGAPKEDIESRALAINSRLAVLIGLFRSMSAKLRADAA